MNKIRLLHYHFYEDINTFLVPEKYVESFKKLYSLIGYSHMNLVIDTELDSVDDIHYIEYKTLFEDFLEEVKECIDTKNDVDKLKIVELLKELV